MIVTELLNQLAQQGIHLWAEGDKLKFRAPQGALTDGHRILLKTHKAEILKVLSERQPLPQAQNGRPTVTPESRSSQPTVAPLTPGQEGIWYLDQLQPDSPAYHLPMVWRIRGPLNLTVLERSLNLIIERHEVFRTSFEANEGQPQSIIQPNLTISLDQIDLQHLPPTEREQKANELVQTEANRLFNLAQAPLLRARVIQLEPTVFILTITIHHIIGDGWSLAVLADDLSAIYNALVAGQAPTLPDLPMQYADYARWKQAQQQEETFATHLAYWQQQLADAPPILELPTDYARPAMHNYDGDQVSLILPPELAQTIQKLSQDNNVTLFMTLLTGFKILLHRYTAQNNIVVGSPIIHRPKSELEPLIGFFLNNLVLHTDLAGQPTFQELLAKVRRTSLDAYNHQDISYETLVQTLQPKRDLSYKPLFQVAFNLLPPDDHICLDLTDLSIEKLSRSEIESYSKFDMTLYIHRDGSQIQFYLVYRTDLFRRERMMAMLTQYQHLLTQIVADPSQPIDAYSLVTPTAHSILPDPTTSIPAPPQPLVTDLIRAWAEKTPRHTAISQGNRTWSYQDLVNQANSLARSLTASCVAPGDVVAIYAPRQVGLIVSMLATLSSGGIFVLLDPFLPDERKLTLLREAQVKWLISVQSTSDTPPVENWLAAYDRLSGHLQVEGSTGQVIDAPDVTNISLPVVDENDPAYIFFTSGSTGKPKGILGCHKGLSHFIRWQGQQFEITPNDRVAQLIGLSFDVILRDVFLPLTQGATLCLPDKADGLNLVEPLAWFKQARITMLHTVPALAQTWLASNGVETKLPDLRCVFFAGEPLTDTLVKQWRELCPQCQVVNLYGPTETTLAKCYYPIPKTMQPGVQPVGYPLPYTQALVLADNDRLCGLNEPGQIVLRTPFRTLGYINAPQKAHQQFRPNPFRNDAHDLLYYTGDLGYYQPDGTLAILGRVDDQVKIRGVRIELGEIIATLAQHSTVQANTVIAKKDEQGQNYLVAYVVPKPGQELDQAALRRYLSQTLMPAMMPTAFVTLAQLPLLPTGKVDRRQLPEPDLSLARSDHTFVAPDGPVEEMLAEIWQELLNLEQISVHNSFFELGGHSLLAIQLLNRLRGRHDIKLSLQNIFEMPTIAELASIIETILMIEAQGQAPTSDDINL